MFMSFVKRHKTPLIAGAAAWPLDAPEGLRLSAVAAFAMKRRHFEMGLGAGGSSARRFDKLNTSRLALAA